jgi:hypothetical protein
LAGAGAFAVAGLRTRPADPAVRGISPLVSGTVFEDRSGTGVRRSGDRGLAGIMVSNGREVVLTDEGGRYALRAEAGDHVFVIKPRDWSLPKSSGCVPFSYLHHSESAPSPSIDFPLRKTPEPSRFEALLFADVQPSNAAELGYFEDLVRNSVVGTSAAFALNHGDVMGDDLSLFPAYRRVIGETGVPWYHCPGNHDMDSDRADPRHAFETWKREIGPTHFAFRYAGATFILLNNVVYAGHGRSFAGGRTYRGLIGERQLLFVENVLRHVPKDDLVVLSMHIPLVSFEDPESTSDTTADRAALIRLLSGRPHRVSFAGHSHTTEHHYLGNADGFDGVRPHHHHVLTAASGSWWSGAVDARGIPVSDSRDGSPKGYHVMSVDGADYTTRFVPFAALASPQMRLIVREGTLVADVFDGGPATQVVYEIEGGAPASVMTRTRAPDPYIVESYARDAHLSKPWVKPAISSHVWTAPLDGKMAGGQHRITVRARLDSGEEHASALTIVGA